MNPLIRCAFIVMCLPLFAQVESGDSLPFSDISRYPDTVSRGAIMARMIDGLGFRYFWATDGLTDADLQFRRSGDSRSISEILDHIFQLSEVMRNFVTGSEGSGVLAMDQGDKRQLTLNNFMVARTAYLETYFPERKKAEKNGQTLQNDPFWYQINGTLEDAVWHCGQIAILRRTAGNPMAPGIDFYRGQKK